jgi:hypothetical protein
MNMNTNTNNAELLRRSPSPSSADARWSASASTPDDDEYSDTDEDLRLALEISKMDTGGVSAMPKNNNSHSNPHSQGRVLSPAASSSFDERASLNTDDLYPPGPLEVQSSFGRQAMSRAHEADHNSLADVLLALKLSAEESGTSAETDNLHRPSTSIDELLTLEKKQAAKVPGATATGNAKSDSNHSNNHSVMDMVAAGISTTTTAASRPDELGEQMRILQQIREEQEQMELEIALKVSQQAGGDSGTTDDFLMSQQEAMEEWSRNNNNNNNNAHTNSSSSNNNGTRAQMPGVSRNDSFRRRRELLDRGTLETKTAITTGQAQIVKCRGCNGRLQAPISYSLVFCPKCQTISPA